MGDNRALLISPYPNLESCNKIRALGTFDISLSKTFKTLCAQVYHGFLQYDTNGTTSMNCEKTHMVKAYLNPLTTGIIYLAK